MPMTEYRRGFKTEADEYARDYRLELELRPESPLSPWRLAEHLEIPVIPLSRLQERDPDAVKHLLGGGRRAFSAATVPNGTRRAIIHNDAHARVRQASNIAHELAHIILGHPLSPPLSEFGCRKFNSKLEAEAGWLGPALLVSREAAFQIVFRGMSLESAARIYGVSSRVMSLRLDGSGVRKVVSRWRARQSPRKAYRPRRR